MYKLQILYNGEKKICRRVHTQFWRLIINWLQDLLTLKKTIGRFNMFKRTTALYDDRCGQYIIIYKTGRLFFTLTEPRDDNK